VGREIGSTESPPHKPHPYSWPTASTFSYSGIRGLKLESLLKPFFACTLE